MYQDISLTLFDNLFDYLDHEFMGKEGFFTTSAKL